MGFKVHTKQIDIPLADGYIPNWDSATELFEDSPMYTDGTNLSVGHTSPAVTLDILKDDATTNGVTELFRLTHTTTGTAADGIGTSINLRAERASGTTVDLAYIQAIMTDATAVDTAMAFFTRTAAGAMTEQLRITDIGMIQATNATVAEIDAASTKVLVTKEWITAQGFGTSSVTELNDLTDVAHDIPGSPTIVDDGKMLHYDYSIGDFVTDDSVTHGTVVINGKVGTALGTIAKGLPVALTGFDADLHEVELADADNTARMPVIGFSGEAMDDTNTKHIITFGKIQGLDTTSTVTTLNPNGETWAVNDELYISTTPGGLTNVRPTGASTGIQRIAKVLRVHATGGQLFIFNTARRAGLPNLTDENVWVGNASNQPAEAAATTLGIYAGSGTVPAATTASITNTLDLGTTMQIDETNQRVNFFGPSETFTIDAEGAVMTEFTTTEIGYQFGLGTGGKHIRFNSTTAANLLFYLNGSLTGFDFGTQSGGVIHSFYTNTGHAIYGGAVFNETGAATGDFRIEGDTNTHLFFTDAGNDQVGINVSTTAAKLHVRGAGATSATTAFLVENSAGTDILTVQDDNKVGINKTSPDYQLHMVNIGGSANNGAGIAFTNSGETAGLYMATDGTTAISANTVLTGWTSESSFGGALQLRGVIDTTLDVAPTNDYKAVVMVQGFEGTAMGSSLGSLEAARIFSVNDGIVNRYQVMESGRMRMSMDHSSALYTNLQSSYTRGLPTGFEFLSGSTRDFLISSAFGSVSDGLITNSPTFKIQGEYDSDPTAGTTSSQFDSTLQTIVTAGGASATGKLSISVQGTEGIAVHQDGTVQFANLTTTPAAGYVLQSTDANGNADWVDGSTLGSSNDVLEEQTTDAASTELLVGGNGGTRISVASNAMKAFTITVTAIQSAGTGTGDVWVHRYSGTIKNIGGTTSIVGTITEETISEDTNTSTWTATVSADDTNDALTVDVTGEALKTIEWLAEVEVTDNGY